MPRLFVISLLLWLINNPVSAQSPQRIRFEHLSLAEGLPENSVQCMLQDHLGFMWMGTQNGLVRYDGTKMTVFQYDSKKTYSLRGVQIEALHEDRKGDIWIGCESLFRFERATGRFIEYPRKTERKSDSPDADLIKFIHEDKQGAIWTITGDTHILDRLTPATKTWTYFRNHAKDRHSLASNSICAHEINLITEYAFLEDKAGKIWVITNGESENILHSFDQILNRFMRITLHTSPELAADFKQITDLALDNKGNLYLSSLAGGKGLFVLNPQTGQLRQFKHDPATLTSLRCDSVARVHQGQDGLVWIPTQQGLDRLDPKTGLFTHYVSRPTDPATPSPGLLKFLYELPSGDLWFLAKDGLVFYHKKSNQFVRYQNPPGYAYNQNPRPPEQQDELFGAGEIQSFLVDRTELVWVGSWNQGLSKQSRRAKLPLLTARPTKPNNGQIAPIYEIYEAPSEPLVMWFGGEQGLDKLDTRTGKYTSYRYDSLNTRSINTGDITAIVEDKKRRFWIATWNHGLNLMDRKTGTFRRFLRDPANPNSLITNRIHTLMSASDGRLWTVTGRGLGRVDFDQNVFTQYAKADSTYIHNLYARINQLTTPERRVAAILHPGDNLNKAVPFTLSQSSKLVVIVGGHWLPTGKFDYGWIEDANGKIIWEASYEKSVGDGSYGQLRNQINVIRLAAGHYRLRYKSDGDYSYGHWMINPPPFHPNLWGIQLINLQPNEGEQIARLARKRHFDGLSGTDSRTILEDSRKQIWIGADGAGISLFNQSTGKFRRYYDQFNGPSSVSSLLEDTRPGCVWVCDYIFGLLLLDANGRILKHYTAANGLLGNEVNTIQRDEKGFLWLGTGNGLTRFDPRTEQFRHYNQSNGLTDLEIRRSFKTSTGEMYFWGETAVNHFYPDQLQEDRFPPPVVLSDLSIGGKPATLGKDGQLPVHISIASQITLPYNQNDLTFHFAALQYNRGNECQYAYKLTPTDTDWIQAGTTRQARYSDLSSGAYTFWVKAANADGVWNEKGTSIRISIHPPWWHTWWAYLLYALVVAGSIWAFIEYRSRALRKENQVLEEKVSLRTNQLQKSLTDLKSTQTQLVQKEKMASLGELTAGIAHEIQNPLNFVNNFSELSSELVEELEEEHQKPQRDSDLEVELLTDLKDNLNKIVHHGNRAASIVKGMLEHARSSNGEVAPTDLNKLADEFLRLAYHGMRGNDNTFNCELVTDFDPALGLVTVMPQEIGRVLLNLFSNAFYAVRQQQKMTSDETYKPTVSVTVMMANEQAIITVRDNGTGMSEGVKAKIFQPFFTTKPTGQGTGLGLSLSYDIITKGHSGSLTVNSQEGQGAEFVLSLPGGSTFS